MMTKPASVIAPISTPPRLVAARAATARAPRHQQACSTRTLLARSAIQPQPMPPAMAAVCSKAPKPALAPKLWLRSIMICGSQLDRP